MFSIISMRQLEVYLEQKLDHRLDFTLLDVRSVQEFRNGHLLTAVNIPMEAEMLWAGDRLDGINEEIPVIVYCTHGSKSLMAARILDSKGYLVMAGAGGLASYRGKYYKSI
ncbi:MAG: rhodanese-like domain-containing protein [Lachnospiraceae bacterium]|nr:rhodanese-like domain-containing protein [Lachnospiraceae bacterium]